MKLTNKGYSALDSSSFDEESDSYNKAVKLNSILFDIYQGDVLSTETIKEYNELVRFFNKRGLVLHRLTHHK